MPSTEPEITSLPDYSEYLHVVAAVIENDRGEVLIARRHEHLHQGGLWEFPGGKVEAGEDRFNALRRELGEELGIETLDAHPLIRIPYHYPDRQVLLDVWRVNTYRGEPHGAEGQPIKWVPRDELYRYDFPAANRPIINAARLPSRYLITPEPGDKANWPIFLRQLEQSLKSGISLVQLRATQLDSRQFLALAEEVVACCHRYGAKLLLNADISAVDASGADGIHLNAGRLKAAERRPVEEGQLCAASCHSLEELRRAEQLGLDFALLSPVMPTATHPQAPPMGWSGFQSLSEQCSIPLYALGGMTPEDLPDAWRYGAQGIAAIRALWDRGELPG